MKPGWMAWALGLVLAAGTAWADQVVLTSGQRFEGIIRRENSTEVEIEVAAGARITLQRAEIRDIERSSETERERLRARWTGARERSARLAAERHRRELEAQQQESITRDAAAWLPEGQSPKAQASPDGGQRQARPVRAVRRTNPPPHAELQQETQGSKKPPEDSMHDPEYDY